MKCIGATLVFFVGIVVGEESCKHAGDDTARPCKPHLFKDATQLHLDSGEEPRDATWGAGMFTTTLDVDVLGQPMAALRKNGKNEGFKRMVIVAADLCVSCISHVNHV
eukprot:m.768469 g.768469  ORF g.768469 m.768469 type:complete len:108 (-) comp23227_c0_seq83:3479-3802(-)